MIVGPSYSLTTRRAAVQRSLNYVLRQVEAGNEKSGMYLQQAPGLSVFADLGAEIRGLHQHNGRLFAVAGNTLYEVNSNRTFVSRGTLRTTDAWIDMASGLTQLVVTDGPYGFGYVLNLSTNAFTQITSANFYSTLRVAFLDGFFLFIRPDTQQFYISAIDDATNLDALDFASAESAPDDLMAVVCDHREIWLVGRETTEVWFNVGGDFPFQRNNGSSIEVGTCAPRSVQKVDNSVFWLGQDRNGAGMVWRAQGYQPQRISNHGIEERIRSCTNLYAARAFTYQRDGLTFYCLELPDVDTTLCFEASTGTWHERVEIVNGEFTPSRYNVHASCFGLNLVGGADGKLYYLDDTKNTLNGDVLYRERTTPHVANPTRERQFFGALKLDCSVGDTTDAADPVIEMQYSDDGGYNWSNWLKRSLGKRGRFQERPEWNRLGSAFDRVWRVRCTDNARADIFGAAFE